MFNTHATRISAYAKSSPEALAHVMEFVILTVQMPLYRVPRDMKELRKHGAKAKPLWGWKRKAWEHIHANKAAIYDTALRLAQEPDAEHLLLTYFAKMPGFGLVKGGFVCQLAFGLGGCLDTHNIARFGLDANSFRSAKVKAAKSEATVAKVVTAYQTLCHTLGGAQGLWDGWCDYVAKDQPNTYKDGFHVSALHCEALGL